MPRSCALLGGFAIGAGVVLLWQHNAKCYRVHACTCCMPRVTTVVSTVAAVWMLEDIDKCILQNSGAFPTTQQRK